MTDTELIKDIHNEITFSGMIPYSLPEKEIKRIIENDLKYFYDNWRYSVQMKYLLLPHEIFTSPSFRKNRQLILPDCIQFVTDAREASGGSIFATIDRDFAESKFIGAEMFITPFLGESLMYRTVLFSFLDLTKSMILETVAYDYNKNTHILAIQGRTPKIATVLKVFKKIDKEFMYEDEVFQRYVRAHAKVRMAQMLQTFQFPLPGDVQLNYQIMTSTADKEMEGVLAMMKGENTPDWMYLSH